MFLGEDPGRHEDHPDSQRGEGDLNSAGGFRGYKQTQTYRGLTLKPEDVVHFRWDPVNGEAFGTGLLRTLLESLRVSGGETRLC